MHTKQPFNPNSSNYYHENIVTSGYSTSITYEFAIFSNIVTRPLDNYYALQ